MDLIQFRLQRDLGPTHWWLLETKRLTAALLRRALPVGGRVLDAGAGVGGLAPLLEPEMHVVSLDLSEAALALARQSGTRRPVRATVEELPFANDSFDGVASLDVLYHEAVLDDTRAIREVARILRPGGLLVLNLPAYRWMRSPHDVAAGTARRYTRGQVEALLIHGGLVPLRISYRNTLLFPLAVVRRKVLRATGTDLRPVHPVLNRLFGAILRAEGLWLRWGTFPFGLSVFAVARKAQTAERPNP